MSKFKEWRLASGYTYDARQEHAWNAATAAERERYAPFIERVKTHLKTTGLCVMCGASWHEPVPIVGSRFRHKEECAYAAIREADDDV